MTRWTYWTDEMDAQLEKLWERNGPNVVGRLMGLSPHVVGTRAEKLQLSKAPIGKRREPSDDDWIKIATAQAKAHGVRPGDLLAGDRRPKVVAARWDAWADILKQNPGVTMAGVARVSGFGKDAVIHAMRRIRAGTKPSNRHTRTTRYKGQASPVSSWLEHFSGGAA